MWLVTGSALALMFAALGPAIAIANLVDSRVHGARSARRERERFERELVEVEREVDAAHDAERRDRSLVAPGAPQRISALSPEALPVASAGAVDRLVRLGVAAGISEVRVEGAPADRSDDPVSSRMRLLRERAGVLLDEPVIVSAAQGIAVIGPRVPNAALVRAILIQLAADAGPQTRATVHEQHGWLSGLFLEGQGPVLEGQSPAPGGVAPAALVAATTIGDVTVESAHSAGALSGAAGVVVRVSGARATILRAPGLSSPREFSPDFVDAEQAGSWVKCRRELDSRTSRALAPALPLRTPFDPGSIAAEHEPHGERATLACAIGRSEHGACTVDLVRQGPHAVVGGTTGSGKSEMLVTWILAMAARYSPRRVTFLLVDFKGGSSFTAVAGLPHSVGLVTDLDGSGARRAIESLAAEVRYREGILAAASVRHIDELPESEALPRLVVVVDEFAAMATEFPELHTQFSDLAARGRSLGLHLVVCTQRPAGVVRDALMANTGLRISLRVNDGADSVAVIGTRHAGESGIPPGRAFVATGAGVREVQIAHSTEHDIAAVVAQWAGGHGGAVWAPRSPWLEPLPNRISLAALPEGCFAVCDLPLEQRQDPLRYEPGAEGNLLVIGGTRSGKSTALASLAAAHGGARVIGPGVEEAWDALDDPSNDLLLLDDLDLLVTLFGPEHHVEFLDRLCTLMRSGRRRVVFSAQRWSAPVQSLASLCDSRLVLRLPTRQDHIVAGGEAAAFEPRLAPGAGWLCGVRVQVAEPPTTHSSAPSETGVESFESADCPRLLVVSRRPRAAVAELRAAGWAAAEPIAAAVPSGDVVVGDPDGWQRHWPTFTALAAERPVLFMGCSVGEVRTLSRTRDLPPPLADPASTAWLLSPDGTFGRVRLSAGR